MMTGRVGVALAGIGADNDAAIKANSKMILSLMMPRRCKSQAAWAVLMAGLSRAHDLGADPHRAIGDVLRVGFDH